MMFTQTITDKISATHLGQSLVKLLISALKIALFAALVSFISFYISKNAHAFEPIPITSEDIALDLTAVAEHFPDRGDAFQVSTAPGTDGIVRRIEVRASSDEHSGDWAAFVLANTTNEQIDRLIVAPHYRLADAGVMWPDLGSEKIIRITPSEGFALDREQSDEADVFRITLNPGTVVTLVAELALDELPHIYLWEPSAYKDTVNSFTLYKGILIGIAALLALFLTNLFIVRWTIMLPATAMLAWTVLIYVSVDFGFLAELLGLGPNELQYWRAGAEVLLAGGLIIFLFTYLNLHNWHINLSYVTLAWLLGLAALFSVIFIDASVAAGIARISFATTIVLAIGLIAYLGIKGYDRAVMLVPTWILLVFWLVAAALTVTGEYDNDILQPAIGGGLVLAILLVSFTVMQYVFTSGIYQQGLFSDSERQSLAITGSGDMVWDWDVTRDKLTTSPDITKSLGLTPNELHGAMRSWLPFIHSNDRDGFGTALDVMLGHRKGRLTHEFRMRAADNQYHWFSLRARPVLGTNGDVIRCVGTIQEITEQKISETRLLRNAAYDNLTGLPNRELLISCLETSIALSQKYNDLNPTVLVIDFDGFTKINQSIGMASADTILLALTRRITRVLKPEDMMARLNGDQFGIVILSETDPNGIAKLTDAIRESVKAPLDFAKNELTLTASIGMHTVVGQNNDATEVLQDTELAMLHAKKFGGDRIEPFRPAYRSVSLIQTGTSDKMRTAMDRRELDVIYQPIVDLETLQIAGFEALLRWEDPKRGLIPPSEFVPIAEKNGFIFELGMHALSRSIQDMSSWRTLLGDLPIFMSVNLSAAQLMKSELIDDIQAQFKNAKCSADQFKFELTETVLVENPDVAINTLNKIKDMGISLALDDFGSGFSSMSYLAKFPFDVLKIDRSITTEKSEKHKKMLKTIILLAKELELEVVAEGVDSTAATDQFLAMGCEYGQSFFLGMPKGSASTEKLLREHFKLN